MFIIGLNKLQGAGWAIVGLGLDPIWGGHHAPTLAPGARLATWLGHNRLPITTNRLISLSIQNMQLLIAIYLSRWATSGSSRNALCFPIVISIYIVIVKDKMIGTILWPTLYIVCSTMQYNWSAVGKFKVSVSETRQFKQDRPHADQSRAHVTWILVHKMIWRVQFYMVQLRRVTSILFKIGLHLTI